MILHQNLHLLLSGNNIQIRLMDLIIKQTKKKNVMKFIVIISAVALLTFSYFAGNANADTNMKGNWIASCNSKYTHSNGTYTFKVMHGEVGGCPDDSKLSNLKDKNGKHVWDFSERSEVRFSKKLKHGKYEWSATVNIDYDCKPSFRSTIVQVHTGGNGVERPFGPPSYLAINYVGKFRAVRNKGTIVDVPIKEPFDVVMTIEFTKKMIKASYYVNGEYVLTEKDNSKEKSIYVKFGVYRVNSNCNVIQTYTNVKLKKLKYLNDRETEDLIRKYITRNDFEKKDFEKLMELLKSDYSNEIDLSKASKFANNLLN